VTREGLLPKALLVAYALIVALLPLAHHDIACHLKSPTHCTTCTASVSGEAAPHGIVLNSARFVDAGQAMTPETVWHQSDSTSASSGRAPPSL